MRIIIPQSSSEKSLPIQEEPLFKPIEQTAPEEKEDHECIRISELYRSEINKDIQAGVELPIILDKALKCISLMTGDKYFYEFNKKNLTERETR